MQVFREQLLDLDNVVKLAVRTTEVAAQGTTCGSRELSDRIGEDGGISLRDAVAGSRQEAIAVVVCPEIKVNNGAR